MLRGEILATVTAKVAEYYSVSTTEVDEDFVFLDYGDEDDIVELLDWADKTYAVDLSDVDPEDVDTVEDLVAVINFHVNPLLMEIKDVENDKESKGVE